MREVLFKTILALVMLVLMLFVLGVGPFKVQYKLAYMIEHTVQPNETLWEIARTLGKNSAKSDIREIIDDIKEASGMSDRQNLGIGKVVRIPIYVKE